jgi:hypothetical protein
MGVVEDVMSTVQANLDDTKFCDRDSCRVVFWSWCTLAEYNAVLVGKYSFTPEDLREHTKDHFDATHVMTVIFEQTVGREADGMYEYTDLVDGDHWFVRVEPDNTFEVIEQNEGSQPAYYGGPRERSDRWSGAREWVSAFGELHEPVYID